MVVKTTSGEIIVRTALLMCSVDLPARSLCANMKQFNGKHSCVFCKCAGVPRERRRMVRDWPPGNYMPRTHLSIVDDAKEAVATAEAVSVFVLSCAMIEYFKDFSILHRFVVSRGHLSSSSMPHLIWLKVLSLTASTPFIWGLLSGFLLTGLPYNTESKTIASVLRLAT